MKLKTELGIIVPTRNRSFCVEKILLKLKDQIDIDFIVVVVDSSDQHLRLKNFSDPQNKFFHIFSNRQSLTHQKNMGIQYLTKHSEIQYFMILDDDTDINNTYVSTMLKLLKESKGFIGIAPGIVMTSEIRKKPNGIKGFINKVFILDSKRGGVVLKSGVNIPVRINELSMTNEEVIETEWIYGCSIWRINQFLYDERLEGQSLFEDMLYSFKARKFGKIGIARNVILHHYEEVVNRPDMHDLTVMWLKNRRLVIEEDPNYFKAIYFIWADLGNLVTNLLSLKIKIKNKLQVLKAYKEYYLQ